MKSIQQTEQLSDRELKAVLRGDEASLGSLIREDAVNVIAGSAGSVVARIMSKTKTAFQVMLEKVIGEEFLAFLEDVAKGNGDASRNGYYSRKIHSAFGDFEIQIPRARYAAFRTKLLAKYGHDLGDISSKAIELYSSGLSGEETAKALGDMLGVGVSRGKVQEIVESTIGEALKFNGEPVPDCPIVYLDATYMPMKRAYYGGKSVESEGILVALGITPQGTKKVLGFRFGDTESIDKWEGLLLSLKERGLRNPRLFVTDGLSGMPDAIRRRFPGALHQRCLVHYRRNLASYVVRKDKKAICDDFRKVMSMPTREEARKAFRSFAAFWSAKYKGMSGMLSKTGMDIFAYYAFPRAIRKSICTSNAIESLNAKLKRETRKRILANSEDNATIITVNVFRSYDKSAGMRTRKGLMEVSREERRRMGFEI